VGGDNGRRSVSDRCLVRDAEAAAKFSFEGCGGLRAGVHVAGHASNDKVLGGWGELGIIVSQSGGSGGGCGWPAGEEVEEGGGEGVDVRAGVGLALAELLEGGVGGGAHGHGVAALTLFVGAGDAEVNELDLAIRHEHDVGRLDVAEDDGWVLSVKEVEDATHLDAVFEGFGLVHGLAAKAV